MMVATLPPRKVWRTLISATLFLMAFFINLYAQANTDDKGAIPVTISGTDIRLEKVFKSIEKQTGLRFNYRSDLLDLNDKVTVNYRNKPLDEILAALLQPRGFVWKYLGSAITLQPAPAVAPVTPSDTLITFSGRVLNDEGTPLPGATVKVKGTTIGTASSSDGGFSLKTSGNSTIVVSYTGYRSQEMRAGRSMAMVKLEKAINDMNEQVVVAYGTTTQRSNVGAVTVIKGEQIQTLPNRSFDKSLQGLVPGLLVTNGTGQPGGGVSNMVLRGISSGSDGLYGSTARNPLIVIDGVPVTQDNMQFGIYAEATPATNPLAQLNPADIASVSILKDAAAISLYGSKASNGVLLVTTKRGKAGKTKVNFSHQTDFAFRPPNKIEMLSQQEYLELLYETYRNTSATWTDAAIKADLYKKFPYRVNNGDTSFYPAPDWYSELYKNAATTLSNNLSLSGGNDKSAYFINLEYTTQQGIVKSSGFDRTSLRLNYDLNPVPFLKLSNTTNFSYNKQDVVNPSESVVSFGVAAFMSPLNPIRYEDGSYVLNYAYGSTQSASGQLPNPVAAAEYNKNSFTAYRGMTSFKADITLLKNFNLSSNVGVDFMLSENHEKSDPRLRLTGTSGNGMISEFNYRSVNIISTNILSYNKKLWKTHQLNVLVAQEAQIISRKNAYLQALGTRETIPYYDDIMSPGYTLSTYNVSDNKQTLLSQFSQLQYSIRDKYFVSGSFRRDGSSLFGTKQQWGKYWSVGGGWILSEENFMKNINSYISYMKLRGSLGIAGNSSNVNNLTRYDVLKQKTLNGQLAITPDGAPGNPNIKWEQTYTWNLGLETKLLNNRIGLNADVYKKHTANLIYKTDLPAHSGYTKVADNIGDMNNTGLELSLNATIIRHSDFGWQSSISWSINKNVLTKAYVPLERINNGEISNEVGRNYNSYYIPVWMGVNPSTGAAQWKDSTGKPTSIYANAKKEFVGKPQPDGFASFSNRINWKGVELNFQLYYQYGFQILDAQSQKLTNDGYFPYINQSKEALNRWQKEGDIAENPIRKLNNRNGGYQPSTKQLFDGDYLRLQQVSISYNIPKTVLEGLKLSNAKIYLQGYNLHHWSLIKTSDPDNAGTYGRLNNAYPLSTNYSIGANITL